METSTNKHLSFRISILVLVIAILAATGVYFWRNYQATRTEVETANRPMNVETAVTPFEEGVLNPPAGFPSDIPLEEANIIESSTSNFPSQRAVQRSLMYHSKETTESKVAEYSAYLESRGYEVSESRGESGMVSLSGTKEGETISIVINLWEEFTRVYITHLDFSGK